MTRNLLTAAVSSAAIIIATPALAAPGGGHGGGGGGAGAGASGSAAAGASIHGGFGGAGSIGGSGGIGTGISGGIGTGISGGIGTHTSGGAGTGISGGAGTGMSGSAGTHVSGGLEGSSGDRSGSSSARGSERSSVSTSTRVMGSQNQNSQGENDNRQGRNDDHQGSQGNPNALGTHHGDEGHANGFTNRVPSPLLSGLTTGLTVNAAGGASLGTVNRVLTEDGSIKGVLVSTANGQTIKLPASSLSVSGNVVTVNTAEAFERGGVPSTLLPGLASGLPVNTSAGASFGTIASVQTGSNGSIRSVTVTGANGQTYQVPANALSVKGNVVTLNTAEAFEQTGIPATLLPGLAAGLNVNTGAGASLGTVSQINTGTNGNIASVVVTAANGQRITVPASALSISGNVATVNTAQAFEGRGVPGAFLPGLSTGLSVQSSAGASLGTISKVVTSDNGTISGVIVTNSSGQRFGLPASQLSVSGNIVTVATVG